MIVPVISPVIQNVVQPVVRRAVLIEPAFVMRIDTTKAGSASDKMIIPTLGAGYDCQVEWGDGTTTSHSGTAPTIEHTYATGGEYDVRITGDFPRIYFNNTGDRLKVLRTHLGDGTQTAIVWGDTFRDGWLGCENNAEVTGVIPSNVTILRAAWQDNGLTEWTIEIPSNVTNLRDAWRENNLTEWTVAIPSSVTSLFATWFNNKLTEWTVAIPSSVTTCEFAWAQNNLTSWLIAIPNSVTNCAGAWNNNGNLSIDPTFLNAAVNVTSYGNTFLNTTIPTEQYSQLLANLEATNTRNNVPFHGGDSKFDWSAIDARNALLARNWTITDGGYVEAAEFAMRVDTTKAGSASDKMIIPTLGAGYDCQVEWGDGTVTAHSGTAPTIEHTYAAGGEYDVRITGDFPRISFNDEGDKLKVLRVHLGDGTQTAIVWGENWRDAWYGCGNNAEVTGVIPSNVTSLREAWFNNNLTSWTVAIPNSVTDLQDTWRGNSLTEWTVAIPSSVTNLRRAWLSNNLTSWTVAIPSGVTDVVAAWFDNNLTEWTVAIPSSVTNCEGAWRNNGNMSIDPTFLNAAINVSNFTNAFNGTTIPTAEYSQLLANLEATNVENNVPFDGGNSKYNADPGEIARDILTAAPRNWTITDGGLET